MPPDRRSVLRWKDLIKNTPLQPPTELNSLASLMYVSVSALPSITAQEDVRKLVSRATEKNARLHITGVLIFSGCHFAQALEGGGAELDELMTKIIADERHRSVKIVQRKSNTTRRFAQWSLGYLGGSTYVDRPIRRVMATNNEIANPELVDEIYAMMEQFTR